MTESRNPYHRAIGVPTLRRSVIVWLDILGYLDLVKEAEKRSTTHETLTALYAALSAGRDWLEEKNLEFIEPPSKNRFALKAFTDNIVIGWPVSSDAESELGNAIFKVSTFQLQMANAGFFLRGAISIGDAYIDETVVYGPAITEAYEGESKLARDPRIILTSSAVDAVKKHINYYFPQLASPQYRYIFRDADDQWFLNYLESVLLAEREHGPFLEEVITHKTSIETKLDVFRNQPGIWSKYAWVAGYHNFFCEEYPQHFEDSHKIGIHALHLRPSRIVDK